MGLSSRGGDPWPRFDTVTVDDADGAVRVTLSRPDERNTITERLLAELHRILDSVEGRPRCRVLVLQGSGGTFCAGMDLQQLAETPFEMSEASARAYARPYMELLRRLASVARLTVAKVDGEVTAGGVGLAAACDLVVATPRSRFALPEALWGLLPAMVIPYLIRRVGFQSAYRMALTTQPLSAEAARTIQLADEVSDDPEMAIRRVRARVELLREDTIRELKRYFRGSWIVTREMEEAAIAELAALLGRRDVLDGIREAIGPRASAWRWKGGEHGDLR